MLMWDLGCINLLLYRPLSRWSSYQTFLHRRLGGWFALPLQWYSLCFVCVAINAFYSLYECLKFASITPKQVATNLDEIYAFNSEQNYTIVSGFCDTGECVAVERAEFKDALHIRNWLSKVSVGGHVAALLAIFVNFTHVALVVRRFSKTAAKDETWCNHPWKMTTRMDWLLLVFCMPMVLCIAALRASKRSWQLMTGNSECSRSSLPCETAWRTPSDQQFVSIEHFEFALYRSDLELAAMFQFYAIYAFVRLIGDYISDQKLLRNALGGQLPPRLERWVAESQSIIKTVAFLGAWAFVVLGAIRSLVSFVTAEMETFPQTVQTAEKLAKQILSPLCAVFALLTFICIINMFVICKMHIVEAKMPQANAKFTGTRLLLIVVEVQKFVLSAFTHGSPFNLRVKRIVGHEGFTLFSPERYFLLHVTLLTWECLGVAALNVFWWKPWSKETFKHAELTPEYEKDTIGLISAWWHVLTMGKNTPPSSCSSSDVSSEAGDDGAVTSEGSRLSDTICWHANARCIMSE